MVPCFFIYGCGRARACVGSEVRNAIADGMNEMGLLPVVITCYLQLSGQHDAACPRLLAARLSAATATIAIAELRRRKSDSKSICNHLSTSCYLYSWCSLDHHSLRRIPYSILLRRTSGCYAKPTFYFCNCISRSTRFSKSIASPFT